MLNEDEFEKASKLLKRNKASGYDDLDANIITIVYELIKKTLLKIFNEPINLGIFSENMKVGKPTSIFKSGKNYYQTIGQFPHFHVSAKFWRGECTTEFTIIQQNNLFLTNSLVLERIILVITFLMAYMILLIKI